MQSTLYRRRKMEELKYPVVEIFDSIQGEGAFIGMPVTFVRFYGCNLHCPWCDSKETWGKPLEEASDRYRMMTPEEIVEAVKQKIVVFTGGEPLLQNLSPIITMLHQWEVTVCVETNGTQPTPANLDWVVCSPKPGDYTIVPECQYDELKYVVDENFRVDVVPEAIRGEQGRVWLQPCDYPSTMEAAKQLADESKKRCASLPLEYPFLRAGIQLHKYLEVQ